MNIEHRNIKESINPTMDHCHNVAHWFQRLARQEISKRVYQLALLVEEKRYQERYEEFCNGGEYQSYFE